MGLIDSANYRLAVSEYENREPSDYEEEIDDYEDGDLVEEAKLEEYYASLEEELEL